MSRYAARTNLLLALAGLLAVVSLATAHAPSLPLPAAKRAAAQEKRDAPQETSASFDRPLLMPVKGVKPEAIRDNFDEGRGKRRHEAIDILAPHGTPVVAVDDGRVARLFRSIAGGITVYQFDPTERFIYYYAHLDRYAEGLKEGAVLKRGDLVGYVGTTGNAPKGTPHLHFAIFRATPERKWWKGEALNPYPFLAKAN